MILRSGFVELLQKKTFKGRGVYGLPSIWQTYTWICKYSGFRKIINLTLIIWTKFLKNEIFENFESDGIKSLWLNDEVLNRNDYIENTSLDSLDGIRYWSLWHQSWADMGLTTPYLKVRKNKKFEKTEGNTCTLIRAKIRFRQEFPAKKYWSFNLTWYAKHWV